LSRGSEAGHPKREQTQSAREPGDYLNASRQLNSSIDVDVPPAVRYTVRKSLPV